MIPISLGNPYLTGAKGMPSKNPLYFMRKSVGKFPITEYDIIVLNADESPLQTNSVPAVLGGATPGDFSDVDFIPAITVVHAQPEFANAYDIEAIGVSSVSDSMVEPRSLGDGSMAMEPRNNHRVVTIKGFVRGSSFNDLQRKISYLNYSFDPVINYLEGASTWDDTAATIWQPFENAGFHVLAWFDQHAWTTSAFSTTDFFSKQPYERLNRMLFGRSIAKPVTIDTKFSDRNAPFEIQLLMIDTAFYEFIPPAEWGSAQFVDQPAAGNQLVIPTYPWRVGPGWRETGLASYRLYHSAVETGTGLTVSGDCEAGWTDPGGGITDVKFFLFTTTPTDTHTDGGNNWDAVTVPVSLRFTRGYTIILSTHADLLSRIRNSGTVRGQHLANARSGIGISEISQEHRLAIAMRVYRPGTGFVATLLAATSVGFSDLPPQTIEINRGFTSSYTGYAGALSTDHLVVDYGVYHIAPTSGGTGAGMKFTDTSDTDLPQNESTESSYNSWLELS